MGCATGRVLLRLLLDGGRHGARDGELRLRRGTHVARRNGLRRRERHALLALLGDHALLRVEAGRDDRDLDVLAERLVDAGAEDDVGVLVGLLLDERGGLLDLLHLHVGAADDVDEDARRAVDRDVVEERRVRWPSPRRCGARPWPLAMPVPMSARPMLLMTVFTSAKSTLTIPLCVMRSLMPLTAWIEDLVGLAERVDERQIVVAEEQELLVRDGDERVDVLGELRQTELGAARALTAFEEEGLGDDAHGERALLAASCAMTGAAPVPVPPPMPAVTKTMSAPLTSSLMRCTSSSAALRPLLGVGARAEALGDVGTDVQLGGCGVGVERLRVRVDDDELDPFEAEVDHRVDGVAAGAAAADDLDACLVLLRLVRKLDAEAHDLPPGVRPSPITLVSLTGRDSNVLSRAPLSMEHVASITTSTPESECCLEPLPKPGLVARSGDFLLRHVRRGPEPGHGSGGRDLARTCLQDGAAPNFTRPTPVANCGPCTSWVMPLTPIG